jgi:signal transduction histidine kinase
MSNLQNMTIRRKLMAIIMIPSVAMMVFVIIAFITWEQINSRRFLLQDTLSQIGMIADNCKASLAFNNIEDAEQVLSTLRFKDSVTLACIYDKQGKIFAQYKSEDTTENIQAPKPQKDRHSFENGYLSTFKQVVLDNEVIGTVYLQDDMKRSRSELMWDIVVALFILPIALAVGYFFSSKLQVMISKPILCLAQVAKDISEKKDYSVRASQESNDEIGYLTKVFNTMLDQIQQRETALTNAKNLLETRVKERTAELTIANEELTKEVIERKRAEAELKAAQDELVDTAHRAGMAEVATDVLHNVGNVLNSINISAGFIREKVLNSKAENLNKVIDMLREHTGDLGMFLTQDERGKHIPLYLTEATKHIIHEHADIAEKLRSLTKNVEHIKQIIKAQQGYARAGGVEVLIDIKEIIEDAVEINSISLARHKVNLKLELDELPKTHLDKQRILQILVNLISNAKHALSNNEQKEKLLAIRCYKYGEKKLRIEVQDNGVGINEENIAKIFRHGFTTREGGHGFGLHSSALAAQEMDGSLTVQSDGPGHGATFILELPLRIKQTSKSLQGYTTE